MEQLIAKWATKGKDSIELYFHEEATETGYKLTYYHYRCSYGGGGVLNAENDEDAITAMEKPWGSQTGPVTVLKTDRPSLKRVL